MTPGATRMSKLEFVVHHDDVRRLARRRAGRVRQRLQAIGERRRRNPCSRGSAARRSRRRPSGRTWTRSCCRRTLPIPPAGRRAPVPMSAGEARDESRSPRSAAAPGRLSIHQSSASAGTTTRARCRASRWRSGLTDSRKLIGVGVDDPHIEEVGGHPDHVVFEPREQDQDDDHRQRQRGRHRRAAQQREPEEIEQAPGQAEDRPSARSPLRSRP